MRQFVKVPAPFYYDFYNGTTQKFLWNKLQWCVRLNLKLKKMQLRCKFQQEVSCHKVVKDVKARQLNNQYLCHNWDRLKTGQTMKNFLKNWTFVTQYQAVLHWAYVSSVQKKNGPLVNSDQVDHHCLTPSKFCLCTRKLISLVTQDGSHCKCFCGISHPSLPKHRVWGSWDR